MAEFDKPTLNEEKVEETKIEETVIEQEPVVEKLPEQKTEAVMSWVDKLLKMIHKYSAKKILEAVLILIMFVFAGLFAFNPESVFRTYDKYRDKAHTEKMYKRTDATPQIQAELDNLRKKYDVSWVSVWEFHNNTNNLDGLPFIFASLNYESINPALIPIAEQFDDVRVSLYPLVTYLRMNEMWYGSVDELRKIDNTAYYRAKALGITYLGFRLMRAENVPNAALSFAFVEGSEMPNINAFIQDWVTTSYKINGILTINK